MRGRCIPITFYVETCPTDASPNFGVTMISEVPSNPELTLD